MAANMAAVVVQFGTAGDVLLFLHHREPADNMVPHVSHVTTTFVCSMT